MSLRIMGDAAMAAGGGEGQAGTVAPLFAAAAVRMFRNVENVEVRMCGVPLVPEEQRLLAIARHHPRIMVNLYASHQKLRNQGSAGPTNGAEGRCGCLTTQGAGMIVRRTLHKKGFAP